MALKKEIEAENRKLKKEREELQAELEKLRQDHDPGVDSPLAIEALAEEIRQMQGGESPDFDRRHAPEITYPESRGCGTVVIAAFVLLLFVALIGVSIAATVWFIGQPDSDGGDGVRPKTELVKDIASALGSDEEAKKHAIYFAKACRGIGGRLEATYQKEDATYDQRSEALALVGHAGEFSTAVKGANLYREIPTVIESVVKGSLEQKDGEVMAGEMTAAERKAFVQAWYDLADAFQKHSGAPSAFEGESR